MVRICPIRISPRARLFWEQHGGGDRVVIQLRDMWCLFGDEPFARPKPGWP